MKPTNLLPILALMLAFAGATLAGAQQFNFTTLAGASPGNADGTGSAARFNSPNGVAVDGAGNVYVADSRNGTIRKITPAGVVSTLVGLAQDTDDDNIRFNYPFGVAVDTAGNVYVTESGNNTIRKITPTGVVSTLTGDGLFNPTGVAVDSVGNVYVADTGNHMIRKITSGGVVSTLAGRAGILGVADGLGSAARFYYPQGVAVDSTGNVYVADTLNSAIRKITPDGVVSTLAGLAGSIGRADGTGSAARFNDPTGVAVDSAGNVYVADTGDSTIRKITPDGVVSTLAGLAGSSGSADGTGSVARLNFPSGVAVGGVGNVYVADTENNTIRKITPGGVVSTLAGLTANTDGGSADGTGSTARFNFPSGVAVDSAGNVYVADNGNSTIRKITRVGMVSTLAGLAGSFGSADGMGSAARFAGPTGVAVDSAGNVYVTDGGNYTIRKITPDGVVSTLAGLAGSYGSVDGTGSEARFGKATEIGPFGLAVDSDGNVYVADTGNHTIRKVTPSGVVSTLAGRYGSTDLPFSWGWFWSYDAGPFGVAVDSAGNVYVADTGNHSIGKITPSGILSTLAGLPGNPGTDDGTGSAARFYLPIGVAVDSVGNVYVTDFNSIRKVTAAGVVTTLSGPPAGWGDSLGGRALSRGSADGTGSAARFTNPSGVSVDGAGKVYVADAMNHKIRLGIPVLVTQPAFTRNSLSRLSDGQFQIEVTASTNQLVLMQVTSVLPATNWVTLHTVTLWNGRATLTDSPASRLPVRFYRAVSPVP